MARRGRVHVPGGRYFVVDEFRLPEVLVAAPHRSHTSTELRQIAANRAQYEAQLAYTITRWCARVHTHCWLPNAALLELQIAWAPLEWVMRSLRASFSRHYHESTGQSGALYAGRYRAWLVDPKCILDLRREISWRPIGAGLCGHPTEYPDTTIHFALADPAPSFLSRSELLAWFEQRRSHPREQLLEFFSAKPTIEFAALLDGSPHDRRIIGYPEFLRRTYRAEQRPTPIVLPAYTIAWVSAFVKTRTESNPGASSDPAPDLVQALTAWLASCSGTASVSTVAAWFPGVNRSRLERAVDHYIQSRPDLFCLPVLRKFIRLISAS